MHPANDDYDADETDDDNYHDEDFPKANLCVHDNEIVHCHLQELSYPIQISFRIAMRIILFLMLAQAKITTTVFCKYTHGI